MSTQLVLTPIDGEPRVHDLNLAKKLGFADQYMIRKLIKRNEDKLLKFGILSMVETIHQGAGRPTAEFYLNQKQALFICMKSETERAFEVQAEIVRVFDAYLKGELVPSPAATPTALMGDAIYLIANQLRSFDHRVDHLETRVDRLELRIQQKRAPQIINTLQIGLDIDPLAKPRGEPKGGTHAAPRSHERQGYWRNCNGKRVWVRPTKVNKKDH